MHPMLQQRLMAMVMIEQTSQQYPQEIFKIVITVSRTIYSCHCPEVVVFFLSGCMLQQDKVLMFGNQRLAEIQNPLFDKSILLTQGKKTNKFVSYKILYPST